MKIIDLKERMVKINYFILYMINLTTSLVIMSLYDKNFRFLVPMIFAISIPYLPILTYNYFFRNYDSSLLKNVIYLFTGMILYVILIVLINKKFQLEDIFIKDLSGFITIYSFIFYIMMYHIILVINKSSK